MQTIKSKYKWVVEGVFGHLLSELVTLADMVIFLDLSWGDCEKALLSRGSERSKQQDIGKEENNFQDLLKWASEYYSRDTKASHVFHELLYNQFDKAKYKLSNRKDIDNFVKQYKC